MTKPACEECIVYTFKSKTAPHGIVQIARVTYNDYSDECAKDLMIDFPERFIKEHRGIEELLEMSAVQFIDER